MNDQAKLSEFYAAIKSADDVRGMALNRPAEGIAACVRKIILANRQHALHIIEAADRALAQIR